jgi:sister chromatid cohesion protein DCC1
VDPIIRYFPQSLLPTEAKNRFHDLFNIRHKWHKDDILPYIEDLASNHKELDPIILKFARISKLGENVFLTSRLANAFS